MLGSRGRGKVVPRKPQPYALIAIGEAPSSAYKALGQELDGNSGSINAATSAPSGSTAAAATTAQSRQFSSSPPVSLLAAAAAKPEASSSSSSSSSSNTVLVAVHPGTGPGCSAAVSSSSSSSSSSSTQSQWRCAPYLAGGHVPELPQHLIGTAKGRQLLSQGHPAVMRNLHLAKCKLQDAGSAQGSRTAAELMQHSVTQGQSNKQQQQQQGMLPVLCSPSDANRFLVAEMSKNARGSYYHLRKPETNVLSMSFADWLAAWQTWESSRLLLQAGVCTWELSPQSENGNAAGTAGHKAKLWPNRALWPNLQQLLSTEQTSHGHLSSPSTADAAPAANPRPSIASLIHWGALQQLLTDGQYQQKGQLQLVAGGRDALLPAQYHTHDRLLCQVSGRQQLLLIPPSQGFKGCYPYPVAHPYDRYSCVDWEEPELEHWPAAAQLTGLQCQLNPGDCFLLPAYWFVHSQLQQPACVSLVLQLHPLPSKLHDPSALLMQLSRMAEIWMAAEVGAASVRRWFVALSEGREWQQLQKQLVTVKGYKLLRVCHIIMEQMQQVLSLKPASLPSGSASNVPAAGATTSSTAGLEHCHRSRRPDSQAGGAQCRHAVSCASALECEARRMLGLMCEGRLMPTHWLNQGITDPLYIKHQPEYYLIEEDAEAAKYPGLFQHRLIGNKPNWQQHAQPLQLALPGSGRTLMPRTDKTLTA